MLTIQALPGRPTACRLHSPALNCTIEIDGLGPEAMAWRLHRRGQPWTWESRAGMPALQVKLVEGRKTSELGPLLEKDLEDGHVRLESGGAAEVTIQAHHQDSGAILPSSLYLALAQQWAQAGVMPLHAAAVLSPQGGILVTGNKAAGKSTLTAAALAAGWPIVTDDWLLLGADETSIQATRIRDFMMLRDSWASQKLRTALGEEHFEPAGDRPKRVLHFVEPDRRFLTSLEIKHLWSLRRPKSGRSKLTGMQPLAPAEAMGCILAAAMPILFSARMPVERRLLNATLTRTVGAISSQMTELGLDMAETPKSALESISKLVTTATFT